MVITISRKAVATAVAIGLVAAGTVTSVSYAAGSTASVSACVGKKGQLGLLSKKNKCGKGFKKVAIAKQGPAGARGPAGVQGPVGAPGAAGPGARKLLLNTSDSGITPAVTVGPFSYRLGCDVTTSGGKINTKATVFIDTTPGVTGIVSTQYSYANNNAEDPITKFYRQSFTNETTIFSSATAGVQRTYVDSMRVLGSDGTTHIVSVELNVDGNLIPAEKRCIIAGAVTPTS